MSHDKLEPGVYVQVEHDDFGDTIDLGINATGQLVVAQRNRHGRIIHQASLGRATKKRLAEVKQYLDLLTANAVDA